MAAVKKNDCPRAALQTGDDRPGIHVVLDQSFSQNDVADMQIGPNATGYTGKQKFGHAISLYHSGSGCGGRFTSVKKPQLPACHV